MMKKNKLFISLVILLITLFIGCNKVFALYKYEVGQVFTKQKGTESLINDFVVDNKGSGNVQGRLLYHTGTNNSVTQALYCLDASLGASDKLKVQRVLNPYDPQDAALLYIMTAESDYHAKTTAIRSMSQFTKYYSNFSLSKTSTEPYRSIKMAHAYVNSGAQWLSNNANANNSEKVFGTGTYFGIIGLANPGMSSSPSWGYKVKWEAGRYVLNESTSTVSAAKNYVAEALNFAANVEKRYDPDKTDKRAMELVTNNGGENGVVQVVKVISRNGNSQTVQDTVYFVLAFKNFNAKLHPDEYVNMWNDPIEGFTIDHQYKVVTDPTLDDIVKSEGWNSYVCEKDNCNKNFIDEIKDDTTYIAFKITLSGTVTNNEGVTLRMVPVTGGLELEGLSGAYLIPEVADHQRFLVGDGDYKIGMPKTDLEVKLTLLGVVCEEGKTFGSKDDCEAYIVKNGDNETFTQAWCNDKVLMCSPRVSCSDYEEDKYKNYNSSMTCQEALKDLHDKGALDADLAQCIGERLVCSATCDSLIKDGYQSKAEYKGEIGANIIKAILALYNPDEAAKVGVNKANPDDVHFTCHACEEYSGKTLAEVGYKSIEELRYQVSDAEGTYLVNGVITCSSNYCKTAPDKNDFSAYKQWIKNCCRKENKLNPGDYNVQEECENGNQEACQVYQEYCSVCDNKFDIDNTCAEFSPGEFTKDREGNIYGPTDVKLCVIDDSPAGVKNNSEYLLSKDNSVKPYDGENGNPYCSVFCKEDYNFDIPSGRYVINGQHFALGMNINATKTCYSGMIDYERFESDYRTYFDLALANVSNPNSAAFKSAQEQLVKSINYINACSAGWSSEYNYDPKIAFDYAEKEYIDMLPNKELTFKAEKVDTKESTWYCTGNDINRTYTECLGGQTYTDKSSASHEIDYFDVNGNGGTTTIPNRVTFAKKTIAKSAFYTPEAVFYTRATTGIVTIKNNIATTDYTLITDPKFAKEKGLDSVAGIPVRLSDNRGVYNYEFELSDVGEFFNSDKLGRLINKDNNGNIVVNQFNGKFKGTYVCSYVVNCPECEVKCIEDPASGLFCNLPGCEDGSCDLSCQGLGCAYDAEHGLLYTVHQTSLIDFTKNRSVGLNWDTDKNEKAAATINEIVSKGESIYKEPEYEFEFTPAVIEFLREENKKGDYTSSDLKCENYSAKYKKLHPSMSDEEKAIYSQILENDYLICESSILTELNNLYSVKDKLDGRTKIQSYLQSDYCKEHTCAIVGAVGPAWK